MRRVRFEEARREAEERYRRSLLLMPKVYEPVSKLRSEAEDAALTELVCRRVRQAEAEGKYVWVTPRKVRVRL